MESNLDKWLGLWVGGSLGGYPHIVRYVARLVAVNAPIFSHGENLKSRGQGTSYGRARVVERKYEASSKTTSIVYCCLLPIDHAVDF